jgi:hypothetical protein
MKIRTHYYENNEYILKHWSIGYMHLFLSLYILIFQYESYYLIYPWLASINYHLIDYNSQSVIINRIQILLDYCLILYIPIIYIININPDNSIILYFFCVVGCGIEIFNFQKYTNIIDYKNKHYIIVFIYGIILTIYKYLLNLFTNQVIIADSLLLMGICIYYFGLKLNTYRAQYLSHNILHLCTLLYHFIMSYYDLFVLVFL